MEEIEKTKKNDKQNLLILVLLTILGLAGLLGYLKYQDSVFPSASIKFSLKKNEIIDLANSWKEKMKVPEEYPISSCTFSLDNGGKNFLDFKLGTKEANRIMREEAPIFYWEVRYDREKQDENTVVQISPDGKLVAFEFYLSKDRQIPNIGHDEAKQKALDFFCQQLGCQKEDVTIIGDTTTPQSNRIDHNFTFERNETKDRRWQGAKVRAAVSFSGNLMTEFNSYLHLPESWSIQYEKMRARNELLQKIATVFYYLLHPIAIFLALSQFPLGNIRKKFALWAAGFVTMVYLADNYNDIPVALAGYSSTGSYQAFLLELFTKPLLAGIFVFILALIMACAGEFMYRRTFPEKLALEEIFTKRGLATKEVLLGLAVGIVWCAVSLGYQIIYYGLGRKVGFWCPIQLDHYQILGSYLPWVGAVGLGVFAATSEEILYRVLFFGITKPLVKRFWLANLLQAAAWGFMHSSYEQQPCYARGLELTIEGMLDGWILRRFGLLPCVVSHYLFDAFCCVTPLFKAPPSLQVSAVVPLIPVLVLLVLAFVWRNKGGSEKAKLNSDIPILKSHDSPADAEEAHVHYQPLARNLRWSLVTFIGLGLLTFAFTDDKIKVLGDEPQPIKINRDQAVEAARVFLSERHIDLSGFLTTTAVSNGYAGHTADFQYIFEKLGMEKTREIANKIEHTFLISVSFIKPNDQDIYGVTLDEQGNPGSINITLSEDEAGKTINKEDAITIVRNFIRTYRKVYFPLDEDQYKTTKFANRLDHRVTFKVPTYTVAEAPLKVSMDVLGDQVANVTHSWDLPHDWVWERSKRTRLQELYSALQPFINGIMGLSIVAAVILVFRREKVRWKTPLKLGLLFVLLNAVDYGNGLINVHAGYSQNTPLDNFYTSQAISIAQSLLLQYLMVVFGLALSLAALGADARQKLKTVRIMLLPAHQDEYSKLHRDYWADAILLGIGGTILTAAINMIFKVVPIYFGTEIATNFSTGPIPEYFNSYFPALADILSTLENTLNQPLSLIIMAAALYTLRLTKFKFVFPILLLYSLSMAIGYRHWQEGAVSVVSMLVKSTAFWFMVKYTAKRNYLAFFLYSYFSFALGRIASLWELGRDVYMTDIATLSVLVLLPLTYLLYNQRVHKLAKKLARNKAKA